MSIPLILVGNHIKTNTQKSVLSDESIPRQDYIEIAWRLGGKLEGCDLSKVAWYNCIRQIEQRLKLDFAEALFAATQLSKHNVVLSTSEKIAIPLAVLLEITGRRIPHVVIAHKLSTGLKSLLFQTWKIYRNFTRVICVCRTQADYAVNKLGIPASAVDFVYDKVDHRFFHPLPGDSDDYILAVGKEQRDYDTLLQAVAGTDVRLIVVASSPWSASSVNIRKAEDTTVVSYISYPTLRDLYARARLVVVPLFDVDYAAGVNTVLEAMAMGKSAIVSQTRGIADYVVDGETGIYVSPGDTDALRDAILSLWEQPRKRDQLGKNARQAVEEGMNLDTYVDRVTEIVRNVAAIPKNNEILENHHHPGSGLPSDAQNEVTP
jgi:glycosyltransferase involved in cell wall biosynthesis